MDDDADTDDEIIINAQKSVAKDLKDAMSELQKKSWKLVVNNIHIAERVKYPGQFNRIGKLNHERLNSALHPSLDQTQTTMPSGSQPTINY